MLTAVGGAAYNVTSVSFGVESANNTQPVTVRLYTNAGAPFPGGTRTQIATTTISVTAAQTGTVVTAPISAIVARCDLGLAARTRGWLVTPEESGPPEVVARANQLVATYPRPTPESFLESAAPSVRLPSSPSPSALAET